MKRTLSLFLSFVMTLSMLSGVAFAETSGDDTYIVPQETVVFDMASNELKVVYNESDSRYLSYNSSSTTLKFVKIVKSSTDSSSNPVVETSAFPGKTVVHIPYDKSSQPYVDLSFGDPVKMSGGRVNLYSGKIYVTKESTPSWEIFSNRNVATMSGKLKENTWYSFDAALDLSNGVNKLTVTYTQELSAASSAEGAAPHKLTGSVNCSGSYDEVKYLRVRAGGSGSIYYSDLKLSYKEPAYKKAKITSIGSDGVVEEGQNVISMGISEKIPSITKDHVSVINSETDEPLAVDSIAVSDGTLDVILKSNLAGWLEYDITIAAPAFGSNCKQKTGDGELTDVTAVSEHFETAKPPFAAKGFEITAAGNELKAEGLVVNTTGTPKNMKLIFAAFGSDGRPLGVEPTNYDNFNKADGEYIEAQVATAGADKFSFFIIDNWTNKTPLLGVYAMVDASANDVSASAVSGGALSGTSPAISADGLDHTDIKLSVRIDVKQAAVTDGIIFVYKKGDTLSDSNPPIYAEAVSTAADGTLSRVIPLPKSLAYGEYTVEFSSEKLSGNLTDNFNHYTPSELLDARKAEILAKAKSATTAAELKETLFGLNADNEEVNSNLEIFGSDADMTAYEEALNRDNIFERMLSSLSALNDYDDLVELFETASAAQVQYEINNPTIMIESTVTTVADTTNTAAYSAVTADWTGTQALVTDGVKNTWLYITNNGNDRLKTYTVSNDTSFGGSVAKLTGEYPTYLEMFFGGKITAGTDVVRNTLDRQAGTIEGRIRFDEEVTPTFSFTPNGGYADAQSLGASLNADTWYRFKWDIVPESSISVSFTEIGSDTPHAVSKNWTYNSSTFRYLRFNPRISVGKSIYLDDVKVYYRLISFEKAKITSVGAGNVADGYRNDFSFVLSDRIPGLASEHITIKNKETAETISADSITVSGDTTQTVDVTLKSNLAGWSEYIITIDPLAFGATALQRVGRQELSAVTAVTGEFTTSKAPLASKAFAFTSAQNTLNAKALVSNTTGEPQDMQFVFAAFDAQGRMKGISPTEHAAFSSGQEAFLEANIPVNDAAVFNFFVIDDWATRKPLFGANYMVNSLGKKLSAGNAASCESIGTGGAAMELGEFDYENVKIEVSVDTKANKVIDGIVFVYKTGAVLSAGNLPVYAKAVSTSVDGTLKTNVLLPKNTAYTGYTVEFVSDMLSGTVTNTFRYYSPEEILAGKRADILSDATAASSAELLMEALMGVNSAGEKVNDNFDVFGKDADMSNHTKNIDKLNVFASMLPRVSGITDYDALVSLFEACAQSQRSTEVANQKLQMVSDAKLSSNSQALMMVMLGVDANDIRVNDNFDVISSNADMSIYNSLKNPSAVFEHMIGNMSYVSDYNSLISCFENAAQTQQTKENIQPSTSSNNSSYGGSSTAFKNTVDAPAYQAGESSAASLVFNDMGGHWAADYAEALYKRGIMKGYDDGSFRGNNSITRAEIAKTIVEAFAIASGEVKSFADISADSWYSGYVANAAAAGIVTGFENGTFGPDMAITRQDAALMIYRAISKQHPLPKGYTFFNDDLDIADYASDAIRALGDQGIITGDQNKCFKPNDPITRAEIATIICRALDYVESH